MNDLLELMRTRRSIRVYTEESIPEETIHMILQAGLLAPSGHGRRPWEFVVIKDQDTLKKLSQSRAYGAAILEHAACAIVVLADQELTDVWVEDCSCAMMQMHLMAHACGVGSCWVQGRLRSREDGITAEAYIKELLHVPEQYALEATLTLGMPAAERPAYELEKLSAEKIHREYF